VLVYIKHAVDINPFKATALFCDVNYWQIGSDLSPERTFVHSKIFRGILYADDSWGEAEVLFSVVHLPLVGFPETIPSHSLWHTLEFSKKTRCAPYARNRQILRCAGMQAAGTSWGAHL
jgi:hypothetical protein